MPPPFTPYFAVNASLISFWVGLAFVLFFTISTLAPCGSFPILFFTVTFHKYADIINLPSYIPLGTSVLNQFSTQRYTIIPFHLTFHPAQFRHKTPPIWASTETWNIIGRNRNLKLWRFAKVGRCRYNACGIFYWWCADCTTVAVPAKCCCAFVVLVQPLSLLLCVGVRSFRLPFAELRLQKATIKKAWIRFVWFAYLELKAPPRTVTINKHKNSSRLAWTLTTYSFVFYSGGIFSSRIRA